MKIAIVLCSCLLMALLLFFSAEAAAAAQNALLLWWRSVLPALFPFYVCADLLQSGGLFSSLARVFRRPAARLELSPAAAPCFLFGALFGFPTGARLCAQNGVPSLAGFCNLCSPVFLLSVLASLFGNRAFFWPVAIAHYGAALLSAALTLFLRRRGKKRAPLPPPSAHAESDAPFSLISSIGEGMLVMLRIGGCIVLFSVLAAVLEAVGVVRLLSAALAPLGINAELVAALLRGALEFTNGCASALACGLAPRITAALCAFLMSFGGLCVYVQARLFVSRADMKRYLPQRLAQGLLAFGIAYLTAPLFLGGAVPAMEYSVDTIRINASGGAAMLGASAVGISAAYLAGVLLKRGGGARKGRRR